MAFDARLDWPERRSPDGTVYTLHLGLVGRRAKLGDADATRFLNLFKQAVSSDGALALADARWFPEAAGGPPAVGEAGARGGLAVNAGFSDLDNLWPERAAYEGPLFGEFVEEAVVQDIFRELSGYRSVLRKRKGRLSDSADFQFPYAKLYKLAALAHADGAWAMTPMDWGKCQYQYHDVIKNGHRTKTLNGQPVSVCMLNGEDLGVLYGDFRGLTVVVSSPEPHRRSRSGKAPYAEELHLPVKIEWTVADANRFVCWK